MVPDSMPGWSTQYFPETFISENPAGCLSDEMLYWRSHVSVSMVASKRSIKGKCVICYELLLSLITSSTNPHKWYELSIPTYPPPYLPTHKVIFITYIPGIIFHSLWLTVISISSKWLNVAFSERIKDVTV